MTVSLEVSEVSKRFDTGPSSVEVLRSVDLTLAGGDAIAVTGPSGSGKSTLLHLIGTLEQPSTGTIEIDGIDPFGLPEKELARFRNQRIGFVFQEHHLLPHYSVLENVVLPTLAHRGDASGENKDTRDRARTLLDRVGLSHRLDHRPAELSGGERQRTAVARALINQPTLLLCDEPTGSLDPETATSVGELLLELHDGAESLTGRKTITLVVTHSMELAARLPRRFELHDHGLVEATS